MPTARGHQWAAAHQRLSCERCGAASLIDPTRKTTQCPYCGSFQLIESTEAGELIEPDGVVRFEIDDRTAHRQVQAWLGSGLFAPDDLAARAQRMDLRPAYYSCWCFDGTFEQRWSCEVKEGYDENARWVEHSGSECTFFKEILVPGVKALAQDELASIAPYNLKLALPYRPEILAGWPALVYDRSLADGSLLARERVSRRMRHELQGRVEVGREKRNLTSAGGAWSDVTFKHLLLPVWTGTYSYRGKEYRLLVNGQTGKVGGSRPRDPVKILMTTLMIGFILLVLALFALDWASKAMPV
jgi:hypothetical protein